MAAKDSNVDRHFERREKAAKAGLYLPSEEELLRGMIFLREDLRQDMREYAERMARRMRKRGRVELIPLASALEELTVEQSDDAIRGVEATLDTAEVVKGVRIEACRSRCRYYLACLGDPQAAAMVAADTASMALREINVDKANTRLLPLSLAWSMQARSFAIARRYEWENSGVAAKLIQLHGYKSEFGRAIPQPYSVKKPVSKEASDDDDLVDPFDEDIFATEVEAAAVVVIPSIGNETTAEGKRVADEFRKFVKLALPLPCTPDLSIVRKRLLGEFPYAASVIEMILRGLVGRRHVHFRPTILVGPPGCGKTRFARRLAEELKVPHELISCGGMSDSAIGGTPRRWSSGEPSLAIMAVRRHQCAGPVIILDEIEKVGDSRHNGNAHDVLVGSFEKETSSRWSDPCIEAGCDLSHMTWLATANAVDSIPAVLRDRCRILQFPVPGVNQISTLAPRILERLYLDTGHDPRWATPLEAFEIETLQTHWPGVSIRRLERLVERLIEVRDHYRPCETDAERLDVHNGLLLSALWDAAFDQGLVTFNQTGQPEFSPSLSKAARAALRWRNPIPLTEKHEQRLTWHRAHQFKWTTG